MSKQVPVRVGLAVLLALAVFSPKSQASAAVEVVGNKCVLVDGKPFFPIGMYQVGPDDIPILARAGFNSVHYYMWEDHDEEQVVKPGQEWLDAAHKHKLMGLASFYRPSMRAMNWEKCSQRIERFRDHPALLAWHIIDEPEVAHEPRGEGERPGTEYVPAAHKMIKEHDPDHPVTAVLCTFAGIPTFTPMLDVIQADYYPVPPLPAANYWGTGFRGIAHMVDECRKASGNSKPFWFVAQAFNYSVQKSRSIDIPPEWKRFPTLRELRTMTYTAIASGARGIFYYSLMELMLDAHQTGGYLSRVQNWETLKQVVGELNQLMPMLTADTAETIDENDNVRTMVKSDGDDIYIIAANMERKPTRTRITVPGIRQATAELLFENGKPASIEDGSFTATFEPVESHIWRVKR